MIKDLRKANSVSVSKAEERAFKALQKYTIEEASKDSEHCFLDDEIYERLCDEWIHLLSECHRRGLNLIEV